MQQKEMTDGPRTNHRYDVIVVGSGAGGLSAAVVAAKAGLSVLLLESTAYYGGTTAISGGGAWIPNNPLMAENGVIDSPEEALAYLRTVVKSRSGDEKLSAYVSEAPKMVAFMQEQGAARFAFAPVPDYEPSSPGFKVGRTILPTVYEGRALGPNRRHLRPALSQMGLFGMQLDFSDVARFQNATRSLNDAVYFLKILGRYAWDKLLFKQTARLAGGNSLTARLLAAAVALGVACKRNTAVTELIMVEGRLEGVVVSDNGASTSVHANFGIVLATGGFGANPEMRMKHIPLAEHGWSLQPEGARGSGIALGIAAGGRLSGENQANGIWVPVSSLETSKGLTVFPHAMFDRHCPGFIVVDEAGKRFVNEAFHYQHFGDVVRKQQIAKCFLIADHSAVRRYGMGLAKPAPFPIATYVRNGYLTEAPTLADLARKLGVDAESFVGTVAKYNRDAIHGRDPEFHRGEDAYSSFMGNNDNQPNPCVGPIQDGPFFGLELRPGEFCTILGLETDAHARVLDAQDRAIEGLYAVGNDMNSPWLGAYPGGGSGIGPAMTFGYVAANDLISRSNSLRGPQLRNSQ